MYGGQDVKERQADKDLAEKCMRRRLEKVTELLREDRDWLAIMKFVEATMKEQGFSTLSNLLRVMPYKLYLKTSHWKGKARGAKTDAGNRCRICNAGGELHTHHRTYEHRGSESSQDLIVLCANCHALFHEKSELVPENDPEESFSDLTVPDVPQWVTET